MDIILTIHATLPLTTYCAIIDTGQDYVMNTSNYQWKEILREYPADRDDLLRVGDIGQSHLANFPLQNQAQVYYVRKTIPIFKKIDSEERMKNGQYEIPSLILETTDHNSKVRSRQSKCLAQDDRAETYSNAVCITGIICEQY